jgi:hypothetical protein
MFKEPSGMRIIVMTTEHILFLAALLSSAVGTALGIAADIFLIGGQGLLTASAVGAAAGSSIGWVLFKSQGLIDEQ